MENASTNGPPKSVAYFSSPVRVAVTITRPGPDRASTNGPLALAVFTKTTRFDRRRASSGAKSCGAMSGPGRLNFATFAANVPCPNRTMTTVSSSPAFDASASSAFVTASRVAAASASSVTFPLSTPSFCDAVSASVVPHFLNSSPCSGVPASPTTMSRCVLCANTAGATDRQATSRANTSPAFCLLPSALFPITQVSTPA